MLYAENVKYSASDKVDCPEHGENAKRNADCTEDCLIDGEVDKRSVFIRDDFVPNSLMSVENIDTECAGGDNFDGFFKKRTKFDI